MPRSTSGIRLTMYTMLWWCFVNIGTRSHNSATCTYKQSDWHHQGPKHKCTFVCWYVMSPGECYYNTMLRLFSSSSVVLRAFSALCMYSKFGHHPHPLGYLCAKFCFVRGLHCWAWKKSHTQSLTHQAYSMPQEPKHLCFGTYIHSIKSCPRMAVESSSHPIQSYVPSGAVIYCHSGFSNSVTRPFSLDWCWRCRGSLNGTEKTQIKPHQSTIKLWHQKPKQHLQQVAELWQKDCMTYASVQ